MGFQICRVCYKRGYDLKSLQGDENCYLQKLTSCVPEIDVYVIANPGICDKCAKMLDIAFELREICLKNDKQYNISLKEMGVESTHGDDFNKFQIDKVILKVTDCICSMCNIQFESHHDKKMHDYKLHRLHRNKDLRKFLEPVINIKPASSKKRKQSTPSGTVSTLPSGDDVNTQVDDCVVFIKSPPEEEIENLEKKCSICDQKFDSKLGLDNHMKLHLVKCCGESFVTISLLQLHMYKEHGRTCGICDENFDDVTALFHHALEHIKSDWYKCNFCGKQFKEDVALEKHKCTYYTCTVCQIIYFTRKAYNTHMSTHISQVKGSDKIVKTITSDHPMESNCELGKKSRKQVQTYVEEYNPTSCCICRLCDEPFQLNIHLRIHMLRNHSDLGATISLVDCQKDKFYREQEGLIINFGTKNVKVISVKTDIPTYYETKRVQETPSATISIADNDSNYDEETDTASEIDTKPDIAPKFEPKRARKTPIPTAKSKRNSLHSEQDVDEGEIICTECLLMYNTYEDLLAHKCTYNSRESEQIGGITEEASGSDEDDFDRIRTESIEENRFLCEICREEFDTRSSLVEHVRTHF